MIKTRIAGTAALLTFGLAAIGGSALAVAAPASAAPAASDSTSGSTPTSKVGNGRQPGDATTGSANGPADAVNSTSGTIPTTGGSARLDSIGAGLLPQSDDLTAQIAALQTLLANNPNPSQADASLLNDMTSRWQDLVQRETGIAKTIGDMMKSVAQNIGS